MPTELLSAEIPSASARKPAAPQVEELTLSKTEKSHGLLPSVRNNNITGLLTPGTSDSLASQSPYPGASRLLEIRFVLLRQERPISSNPALASRQRRSFKPASKKTDTGAAGLKKKQKKRKKKDKNKKTNKNKKQNKSKELKKRSTDIAHRICRS
ncbi:MAG: hypothetical protein Q9161_006165 [Pseudevernia consocians]